MLNCRYLLVAGLALIIFAASARKRARTAATVSLGTSFCAIPMFHLHFNKFFYNLFALVLQKNLEKFNAFLDVRCAHARSAKTANLMTCLSFQTTTAVSRKG